MNEWQAVMAEDGWNSLFLSNHDLPRQVSKYGDDGEWRVRSAKCIATVIHLMKGTPYVYQGEEIGMTNMRFERIDQFRDIETLRHYAERIAAGVPREEFIAGANVNGRDNARTPVQWTAGHNAGFTEGTPWIEVNPNHETINVEADRRRPGRDHRALPPLDRAPPRRPHGVARPLRAAARGSPPNRRLHPQPRRLGPHRGDCQLVGRGGAGRGARRACHPRHLPSGKRGRARPRWKGTVTLAPWEAVAIRG